MFEFADRTIDYVFDLLGRRKNLHKGKELFSFLFLELPEETFAVVHFEGEQGLNQLYRFEFTLVSENKAVNIDEILLSEALFLFMKDDDLHIPIFGITVEFEQMHQALDKVYYRAVIVPKLWYLTQTYHNQVFLNKTVPEILTQVLEDGGLTSLDYEFRLQEKYEDRREYVCQYQETHFNFFSRWLEREGMYFFFEITDEGSKVVITDSMMAHRLQENSMVRYYPATGLEYLHQPEILNSFNLRQSPLPADITLNDYNYRRPDIPMLTQAHVSNTGTGHVYLYGEHYQNKSEGKRLAKVRAEELLCRQKIWHGTSCITRLCPGYTFSLTDHYRGEFNIKYLTTTIRHEGSQAMAQSAGLGLTPAKREKKPYYRNSFTAIPASVQYRPHRTSKTPHFYGTLNAHIDAAGSGKYAEVDEQGRYKVVLPFDLSGRKDGKASAWLRMAQPYVGSGHGMHFPLHKGVEVLLSFVEGNPDRPIISAAVPNPAHPGLIHNTNQTKAGFQTAGGSSLHVEDKEGSEHMVLKTGGGGGFFKIGQASPQSEALLSTDYNLFYSNESSMEVAGGSKTFHANDSITKITGEVELPGWSPAKYLIGTKLSTIFSILPTVLTTGAKAGTGVGMFFVVKKTKEQLENLEIFIAKLKAFMDAASSPGTDTRALKEQLMAAFNQLDEETQKHLRGELQKILDLCESAKQEGQDNKKAIQKQIQVQHSLFLSKLVNLRVDMFKKIEKQGKVSSTAGAVASGVDAFFGSFLFPIIELLTSMKAKKTLVECTRNAVVSAVRKNTIQNPATDESNDYIHDITQLQSCLTTADFHYSVVGNGKSTLVKQDSGLACMGNFFYADGHQISFSKKVNAMFSNEDIVLQSKGAMFFRAAKYMDLRAKKRIYADGEEELTLGSEKTSTVVGKGLNIISTEDGNLKKTQNTNTEKKGVQILADTDGHDIVIKQSGKNKDGKIFLTSNKKIRLKVGDNNRVTISEKSVSMVVNYPKKRVSLNDDRCLVQFGSFKIRVDEGGITFKQGGRNLMKISGDKVETFCEFKQPAFTAKS